MGNCRDHRLDNHRILMRLVSLADFHVFQRLDVDDLVWNDGVVQMCCGVVDVRAQHGQATDNLLRSGRA